MTFIPKDTIQINPSHYKELLSRCDGQYIKDNIEQEQKNYEYWLEQFQIHLEGFKKLNNDPTNASCDNESFWEQENHLQKMQFNITQAIANMQKFMTFKKVNNHNALMVKITEESIEKWPTTFGYEKKGGE